MDRPDKSANERIAEIMQELRRGATARLAALASEFDRLREALVALYNESEFHSILSPLNEANAILDKATSTAHDLAQLEPETITQLEYLAKPPGHSYPLWHPKGWVACLYRACLGRQYAFNELLLSCVARIDRRAELARQLAYRLIGTCNAQLSHLVRQEKLISETLIATIDRIEYLFCAIVGTQSPEEKETGDRNRGEDTSRRLDAVTEISSLKAFLSELELRLSSLEERSSQWQSFLENWAESATQNEEFRRRLVTTIEELRNEVTALTQLVRSESRQPPRASSAQEQPKQPGDEDHRNPPLASAFSFLDFERALRGGEVLIAEQQAHYVPWFKELSAPVLDIGCGRGEFLELLRDHGIPAMGIDCDVDMVRYCREKGLQVEVGELTEYLNHVADESIGGVFMGQVIEHLERETVLALPALLWRKLVPGGTVVIETVNPMCLSTFAGAMYADPTHVRPIHPKGLEFLFSSVGFTDTTIVLSAPVPDQEKLAPLQEKAPLDPVAKDLVLQMNDNIARLNTLLYSYANYALAARKPKQV